MTDAMPAVRPLVPHFSSGPCAKRPGWSLSALTDAVLGRSHRSKIGKAKLKRAIDLTREVLDVPADYRIGIVPASDTGAAPGRGEMSRRKGFPQRDPVVPSRPCRTGRPRAIPRARSSSSSVTGAGIRSTT